MSGYASSVKCLSLIYVLKGRVPSCKNFWQLYKNEYTRCNSYILGLTPNVFIYFFACTCPFSWTNCFQHVAISNSLHDEDIIWALTHDKSGYLLICGFCVIINGDIAGSMEHYKN